MKIRCRKCGALKERRWKKFLILSQKFGNNRDLVKNSYICRKCRSNIKKGYIPYIADKCEYALMEFKVEINKIVKKYSTIDMSNPENRGQFLNEVNVLITKNNIKDFKFNINKKNGKLQSISLYNIPFYKEVKIPIINKGDKDEICRADVELRTI
jgi:hypothetical protein